MRTNGTEQMKSRNWSFLETAELPNESSNGVFWALISGLTMNDMQASFRCRDQVTGILPLGLQSNDALSRFTSNVVGLEKEA